MWVCFAVGEVTTSGVRLGACSRAAPLTTAASHRIRPTQAADLPLLTLLDCSFSLALPPAPEQRAGGKVFRAGSASPLRHTAAPAAQRSPPPLFGPEAVRVERSSRVLIRGDGIPHSPAGTLELGCPRLRKLSLFGCTRIQGVVLDTFELEELNITNCSRLKGSALDISKCCHLQASDAFAAV